MDEMRTLSQVSWENDFAASVPWWWKHAGAIQGMMCLCMGMIQMTTATCTIIGAVAFGVGTFNESLWFAPWFAICLIISVFILTVNAISIRRYYDGLKYRNEDDRMRIHKYRSLPNNITRKLRKSAKEAERADYGSDYLKKWSALIDELYVKHGEVNINPGKPLDKKAIQTVDKMMSEIEQEKEQLRIARELEDEIRASMQKQGLDVSQIGRVYG